MQWVQQLSIQKIPFYIYKLNKHDCILYESSKNSQKSLIILHGIMYVLKVFTNNEITSTAILSENHIINIKSTTSHPKHYYYKAIAFETTYIISFQWQDITRQDKVSTLIFNQIIKSYENTIYRYEQMSHIMTHKYIKNRIVQLILFLCQEFGVVKKQEIIIPFEISQINIGNIVGSNKVTTNKIIKTLSNQSLIKYSKNKKIILKDPLSLNYIKYRKYE
uniref:global nitrogen transcriptional regulator n=1 Tax=Grateloupia asiatica TaxID=151735 RepID=UPI002A7EF604|nr:global nitrogen transcriptional regulator [Grateloupia asiatica]WOL36820.1 global nitrogen transcriptional regulator [Grateloupia asiatica]